VDRVIASLERAAAAAARDYRFIVLSDHGQSQGATFRDRYGSTLEELLRGLMGGEARVTAATGRTEAFGPVNALLTELIQRPGVAGRVSGRALRSGTADGAVQLERMVTGRSGVGVTPAAAPQEGPAMVVCASGNLAHVYVTDEPGRMTAEQLAARYPDLLPGLAAHPGIGFVMVRSETRGTLVLGPAGIRHLADDRIDGEDPLGPFGPAAADHLRRLDTFPDVGDLVVNSVYDPDLGEVAAFEELVGSHGGLGGPQNRPFLLHPSELAADAGPFVGAPAVHRQLRRWVERLGIAAEDHDEDIVVAAVARPRGVGLVAAYMALSGLVVLLGGLATMALAGWGRPGELPGELGRAPAMVGFVLAATGLFALATALGLWRRQRWARLATLAVQGLAVLQVIFALASDGIRGVVAYGLLPAAIALVVFYYLTRPHVAAAFEHPAGRAPVAGRVRGRES
jgi:hypothetical protein